jgi:spermidine/putrescine-binding protein
VSMGMYTFVYAKDKISQLPETYAPMFDPQYADHIALRDYGLYRVLETAAYLGMDPNNLSDQDVDKIFETMTEQRKLVRAYWQTSSQLDELLANREVWLADYWFDTLTRPDEEGKNRLEKLDVGWWFPKEGGPMWSGGVVIASGCEDPQRYTAELLIDYLFKPEVYTAYAKAQGYTPVLEPDLYDSKAFFSDIPDRAAYRDAMINTGTLLNLSQIMANQENWNERYEEMKLGQ